MNIGFLLDMAAEGMPDRVAVGSRTTGLTYQRLCEQAGRVARLTGQTDLGEGRPERLAMLDLNSPLLPAMLFGAAKAGVPFVPLNYRLADAPLRDLVARNAPALLVVDPPALSRLGEVPGIRVVPHPEFEAQVAGLPDGADAEAGGEAGEDDEEIAVLLFTSGTTGPPKAAVLRHRHLASYILSTVEFASAGEDEAALVSVPPYHVAGVSAILSAVYAGRRLVYLPAFSPAEWVALARDEQVTHAMLVPTMLGRILDELERTGTELPALAHLSYGGGPMPLPVIERAMRLLPHVDYVNAYGLTETSSTVSILTPQDHRDAAASDDPGVRARLGSVGRPLPTLELEIRDASGQPVAVGDTGEVWVRGEQIAGEYHGSADGGRSEGWFATRDSGYLDSEGYLFLTGRLDDVIVRGGENISPGEIEAVLLQHEEVHEAAVVGVADVEWGESVVAYVVLRGEVSVSEAELQQHVRERLRSTCTPERVHFVPELPYSETGKLLRRVLRDQSREAVRA